MVKLLLDAGADVNLVQITGQAEQGGPLWIQGVLSPKDALELVRAIAGQSRP